MHREAYLFIEDAVTRRMPALGLKATAVLEIGSRVINGSPRPLFRGANYWGTDCAPGLGVDAVVDGETVIPPFPVDVVVCAEVLEHAMNWRGIVINAHDVLSPGGVMILTMATDNRSAHSAVHGGALVGGEYYGNVNPDDMADLVSKFFDEVTLEVHRDRGDLYVFAVKKKG